MTTGDPQKREMQALVLHAVNDHRHETVPMPTVGEDGVLVRVGFCGVCGSDIPRIFEKGTYSFPTICGHEFAGTVEAVGSSVGGVQPGDRVAVFPLLWCGTCAACEEGKYVQCLDYDYLGSRRDGAFAEYVVAPPQNLVPIPDGVSLEEAAMTEPAAVALHALKRAGGASIGETVVVFGAGPIGLMAGQWARAMGASRVALFDIDRAKLDLARTLGFDDVFNSGETEPVETIEKMTGGQGAHLCVEGAGVPPTFVQALKATRRAGRVVIMGNPSSDVTLPASLISQAMRREVGIYGTWNSEYSACGNDDDWRATLDAMARGTLDLKPLITHRVGFGSAEEALAMMRDRSDFFAKVLIEPGAP